MTVTNVVNVDRGGLKFHMQINSVPGLVSNSVIIEGENEVVLIDTPFLISDGKELADRVKAIGKKLKSILITHAHPDHYGTMPVFQEAFPDTPILARQPVIDGISEWPAKQLHWQDMYGDLMAFEIKMPAVLEGDHLEVDGRQIQIVDLPPAETVHATAFYMPQEKAFIAGDLAFESTHLYMADTNNPVAWLKALDNVRKLGPIDLLFPGHGNIGGIEILDQTASWLDFYHETAKPGVRFTEIAKAMYQKFPDYGLPIVLWLTRGPSFGLGGPVEAGVPPEVLG